MNHGPRVNSKPVLSKLLIIMVSFAFSFTPLLAAETAEFSNPRINRQQLNDILSQSANLEVTDFDLTHDHVANQLVIKFADWAPTELVAKTLVEFEAEYLESDGSAFTKVRINMDKLREPRERDEVDRQSGMKTIEFKDVIEALNAMPHVVYAEPDYIATALASVNDPYYKLQWNFPLIGVPEAWDSATGENVTVAVIDTGVAYENWSLYKASPDLSGTKFTAGYNAISNNNHANDDNGHGTHIAGTIAGSTNNNLGVAGIAYNAKIMPIKALDKSGSGSYSNIAKAIRWAVDNGADIISLSLGGPASSNVMYDAVKYASDNNVLVVAAAGNSGYGKVLYPAGYDEYVMAVGAVRYDKKKTSYSNYGASLDIMAPGGDTKVDQNRDGYPDGIIQETLKQSWFGADTRKFSYYFYQGTSMAAPHVAGVAALVKSAGVTNSVDIKQILLDTAEDLGSSGWDSQTGHGLVQAQAAVNKALSFNQEEAIVVEEPEVTEQPIVVEEAPVPVPEQPTPTPEEEPAPEENNLLEMSLDANTYNRWGRIDTRFAFWEDAILKVQVNDNQQQALAGVDIDVKVFDGRDKLVAKGTGISDNDGELLLELGQFARGSYKVVVEAVKQGFKTISDSVTFRFR